jgi:UDP-N-acetylglucosamine--N-acetylmuramyl-(pentapeptide) pyrophosphoryl-undecaprenol N-acetylglucosamine transferase
MKVLIAGGGTGGHIYPALAIADAIKRCDSSAKFIFVGTKHGLEATLVPRAGYDLQTIRLYGFQRRISWRNLQNVFLLGRSLWDVRKILRNWKPDVAVGTGGYVCGPALWMAAAAGIPALIQEQNAFPGITNRILSRVVDVVALGYAAATDKLSSCRARLVVTGNPVRLDLLSADRIAAAEKFGLRSDVPTVLITGGSQGARSINQAALTVHRRWKNNEGYQLLHITGPSEYESVSRILTSESLPVNAPQQGRIVLPYLHDMPSALALADIVVSRAGAIGLAELMVTGLPSILIPYPYASENHQEINARELESKGAAQVILDRELTGDGLTDSLQHLLTDRAQLKRMASIAQSMGHPDAADVIAELVMDLTSHPSHKGSGGGGKNVVAGGS